MQEAQSSGNGLYYVVLEEEVDAPAVLGRVAQGLGHLLVEFPPRRLQHGRLMRRLAVASVFLGEVHKGKRAQDCTASCARP
jgi:hypothetical protein